MLGFVYAQHKHRMMSKHTAKGAAGCRSLDSVVGDEIKTIRTTQKLFSYHGQLAYWLSL